MREGSKLSHTLEIWGIGSLVKPRREGRRSPGKCGKRGSRGHGQGEAHPLIPGAFPFAFLNLSQVGVQSKQTNRPKSVFDHVLRI